MAEPLLSLERAPEERGLATSLGALIIAALAIVVAIGVAGFGTAPALPAAVLLLAGALLIVTAALWYVTATLRAAMRRVTTVQVRTGMPSAEGVRASPFGDVHDVIDVEGIGPSRAATLRRMGLRTTRDLWSADAEHVAGRLKVGSSMVREWQQMSELMAVNGIGKQYSELLVKAGVTGIADLAAQGPEDLLRRCERAEEGHTPRIQQSSITLGRVEGWIAAARDHAPAREVFRSAAQEATP